MNYLGRKWTEKTKKEYAGEDEAVTEVPVEEEGEGKAVAVDAVETKAREEVVGIKGMEEGEGKAMAIEKKVREEVASRR